MGMIIINFDKVTLCVKSIYSEVHRVLDKFRWPHSPRGPHSWEAQVPHSNGNHFIHLFLLARHCEQGGQCAQHWARRPLWPIQVKHSVDLILQLCKGFHLRGSHPCQHHEICESVRSCSGSEYATPNSELPRGLAQHLRDSHESAQVQFPTGNASSQHIPIRTGHWCQNAATAWTRETIPSLHSSWTSGQEAHSEDERREVLVYWNPSKCKGYCYQMQWCQAMHLGRCLCLRCVRLRGVSNH